MYGTVQERVSRRRGVFLPFQLGPVLRERTRREIIVYRQYRCTAHLEIFCHELIIYHEWT